MELGRDAPQAVPDLVARAKSLAAEVGFTDSCTDETGRLLRILARRSRRAAEIGTGYGVGACWILSGLPPAGSLVTIELDRDRARAAQGLLRVEPAVRVRHGDWHELLAEPPFDLLFADGGGAKQHGEQVLRAVAPGGLVVLDDFTPLEHWPRALAGRALAGGNDPVREFWLTHPGLVATELRTAPDQAVILAARLP